ncbi:putative lipid II flippase FtsW [Nitrosomonas halophila]|uniref:Probable peptidoglycan glycosyltransferase FtsW n=1 Tax=Nitrosomonas halophila TaxID=44576 RepID=A0A1H3L5M8_9PROT|nr:putative lipid II flippase FtsW [Nitrosomonas halophila]SDY59175.1 cell division protein FtsW [Nitrosomonas halophila]
MSTATLHRQPIETVLDLYLVCSVLALLGLGLVMVYSASIAIAETEHDTHGAYYYLIRQSSYILAGLIAGYIAFQAPLHVWREYSPYLLVGGIFLLALVLIPGVSREINGSHRWLSLGVVNFQPSELMKLLILVFTADYVVRKAAYRNHFFKGFLPILCTLLVVAVLLLREPDYGALVVTIAIVLGIMFMGGMSLKVFLILACLLPLPLILLISLEPYRMDRIIAFMDPWADPFDKGYQLSHALIAFGLGEWWGVGLGGSVEKLHYLPEAHTDFMLAVLAEELGLAGVATVMALFACLLVRAFSIGRTAIMHGDHFAALVAQGIGIWLGLQAFINMGVNMGLLPTKGLTLPFMSYGGSSIFVNCLAIALLLRIDWENRLKRKGLSV